MVFWLSIAAVIIVLDQITKILADTYLNLYSAVEVIPYFNLTLAYNEGAAFSFLSDAGGWQRWFFSALAAGVSAYLIFWLKKLPKDAKFTAWSISLILGGAIGNLIDRLLYGHVIDFLDVYYENYHWPAFNIADSAITVGAILLLYTALFTQEMKDD